MLPAAGLMAGGMMGGGGGGMLPSMTGGEATSTAESQTGSIYAGPVDIGGLTNDFNFGGSGSGLNTGASSFLPLAIAGVVALLGVLWLKK